MKALLLTPYNVRAIRSTLTGEQANRFDMWLSAINPAPHPPTTEGDLYFVTPFKYFIDGEEAEDKWMIVPESKLRKFCRPFELPREPTEWFDVERIPPN